MPAIYAELTPPTAQLAKMNSNIVQSPKVMQTLHKRSMTRLGQRALVVLKVEPPQGNTAGITRLMTPRQRRFVHALRNERGGDSYVRTHAVSQGWKYKVVALDNGGEFVLYNENPVAGYVEGFEQQPFLATLGWLYAPPLLAEFSGEAEQTTELNWFTASDPFAGIPA